MQNNIINDWDEKVYHNIAVKSNSKQAAQYDIKYARMVFHYKPDKAIHFRTGEKGIILGIINKNSARIICVAVAEQYKQKGIGRFLLQTVERYLRNKNIKRVYTITNDGVKFCLRNNYIITGKNKNGWKLEKTISNTDTAHQGGLES